MPPDVLAYVFALASVVGTAGVGMYTAASARRAHREAEQHRMVDELTVMILRAARTGNPVVPPTAPPAAPLPVPDEWQDPDWWGWKDCPAQQELLRVLAEPATPPPAPTAAEQDVWKRAASQYAAGQDRGALRASVDAAVIREDTIDPAKLAPAPCGPGCVVVTDPDTGEYLGRMHTSPDPAFTPSRICPQDRPECAHTDRVTLPVLRKPTSEWGAVCAQCGAILPAQAAGTAGRRARRVPSPP